MTQPVSIKLSLLHNCLMWFHSEFHQRIVSPIVGQFPNYALPSDVKAVLDRSQQIRQLLETAKSVNVNLTEFAQRQFDE